MSPSQARLSQRRQPATKPFHVQPESRTLPVLTWSYG